MPGGGHADPLRARGSRTPCLPAGRLHPIATDGPPRTAAPSAAGWCASIMSACLRGKGPACKAGFRGFDSPRRLDTATTRPCARQSLRTRRAPPACRTTSQGTPTEDVRDAAKQTLATCGRTDSRQMAAATRQLVAGPGHLHRLRRWACARSDTSAWPTADCRFACGCGGTGIRAGLRGRRAKCPCGFDSHHPHNNNHRTALDAVTTATHHPGPGSAHAAFAVGAVQTTTSGCGGTGIRARFKPWWASCPCGFDPHHPHFSSPTGTRPSVGRGPCARSATTLAAKRKPGTCDACGCGGTGRRAQLKTGWALCPCGFDPHHPHHHQPPGSGNTAR